MPAIAAFAPADIRHLVVLGHPAHCSFNHVVAERYCETVRATGQRAVLRDLYAIGFDPLLREEERSQAGMVLPAADVATERHLLARSSVIVLVYPLWLGMPPAIIKGYIDRVLGTGCAAFRGAVDQGDTRLQGKRLVIFSSSGSTRPWLEEKGQWVALRQVFDRYLAAIFAIDTAAHMHFDAIVPNLKPSYFAETQALVEAQARSACSEALRARHAQRTRAIIDHAAIA